MNGPALSASGALSQVLTRAADPATFEQWLRQVRSTGHCTHPIRLVGRLDTADLSTGLLQPVFDTKTEPDGVLLKSCGNRRATVCPSCSATYQADAWQLIAAGLRGGKGMPALVAAHPRVFVTLTAPSFGPVHSCREDSGGRVRRCGPRRRGQPDTCRHGLPTRCSVRHGTDDERVGQPLCPGCFDYAGAVLWNAHCGELWRRTTIATRRALATAAGLTIRALRDRVRLSFSKVAEYQARGVVHLHAVLRLDGASDTTGPPPAEFTVALLDRAIRTAARVHVPIPAVSGEPERVAVWGTQLDVRHIPTTTGDDGARERMLAEAVAGYIAKYATKSSDPLGALDHRLHSAAEINTLPCSPHLRRLVATAWSLGGRHEFAHLRLRAWAHALGFRGHWTTKSRSYSTTLTALRTARRDHLRSREEGIGPEGIEWVGNWRYAGRGYHTDGDAWLAASAAAEHARARRAAATHRRTGY